MWATRSDQFRWQHRPVGGVCFEPYRPRVRYDAIRHSGNFVGWVRDEARTTGADGDFLIEVADARDRRTYLYRTQHTLTVKRA